MVRVHPWILGLWVAVFAGLSHFPAAAEPSDSRLEQLHRQIELDPGNVESYLERAAIWLSLGAVERALADLDFARQLDPRISDPRGPGEAGGDTGAIEEATQSLRQNPRDPNAWMRRAALLLRSGRVDAALRDLDRARQLDPGLAREAADPGAEVRPSKAAPEDESEDSDTLLMRASRLLLSGRVEDALADLDRARRLDPRLDPPPGDVDGYLTRASRLLLVGRVQEALDDLERARALEPRLEPLETVDEFLERASMLMAAGLAEEALRDLDAARHLQPGLGSAGREGTASSVYPHAVVTKETRVTNTATPPSGDFVLRIYLVGTRAGGRPLPAALSDVIGAVADVAPVETWALVHAGVVRLQADGSAEVTLKGAGGWFDLKIDSGRGSDTAGLAVLKAVRLRQWIERRDAKGQTYTNDREPLKTSVRIRDGETSLVGGGFAADDGSALALFLRCEFVP